MQKKLSSSQRKKLGKFCKNVERFIDLGLLRGKDAATMQRIADATKAKLVTDVEIN